LPPIRATYPPLSFFLDYNDDDDNDDDDDNNNNNNNNNRSVTLNGWLELPICIWEVPDSNLVLEPDYILVLICGISQLPINAAILPQFITRPAGSHTYKFIVF
jgi:hypothetical protein